MVFCLGKVKDWQDCAWPLLIGTPVLGVQYYICFQCSIIYLENALPCVVCWQKVKVPFEYPLSATEVMKGGGIGLIVLWVAAWLPYGTHLGSPLE